MGYKDRLSKSRPDISKNYNGKTDNRSRGTIL